MMVLCYFLSMHIYCSHVTTIHKPTAPALHLLLPHWACPCIRMHADLILSGAAYIIGTKTLFVYRHRF